MDRTAKYGSYFLIGGVDLVVLRIFTELFLVLFVVFEDFVDLEEFVGLFLLLFLTVFPFGLF
jgi:hypothetical protein